MSRGVEKEKSDIASGFRAIRRGCSPMMASLRVYSQCSLCAGRLAEG